MVTGVPLARVTVPTVGRPLTVMVRTLLVSTSVGAAMFSGVPVLSSSTVTLVSVTTGASLRPSMVTEALALVTPPWPSLTS